MAKCPKCGAPMEDELCGYCGYVEKKEPQPVFHGNDLSQQAIRTQTVQPQVVMANQPIGNPNIVPGVSRKNKMTALILCIFLGGFGAHKFYVGKVGMGIIYLITLGLFGIGWVIDIILIAMGSFRDEFDLPLRY